MTYDLLASSVLTSSASSVTFDNLNTVAAGYRDLIVVSSNTIDTTAIAFRVNSDTGSNYNYVRMSGDGSTASSFAASNKTPDRVNPFSNISGTVNSFQMQFLDFSATDKHKSILIRADSSISNSSALAYRWANTAAITQIYLYVTGGNFLSGSQFHLYGIAA